jgi:hypothetical protein
MVAAFGGADRHAGNPIRTNTGLVQRLIDPGLIGAQGAAARNTKATTSK